MANEENLRQFVESYLRGQPIQNPTGKTYKLRYGRTVNLGNYESCRIELEETYDESVPRDKALENLARRIEGCGQLRKKHPSLWVPKAEMEAR